MFQAVLSLVIGGGVITEVDERLSEILDQQKDVIGQIVVRLYSQEVSPESTFQFEQELEAAGKELLRLVFEWALNQLEPNDPEEVPHAIQWQCGQYLRVNRKSPTRHVATRFGTITL